jgi:hypothetical protein
MPIVNVFLQYRIDLSISNNIPNHKPVLPLLENNAMLRASSRSLNVRLVSPWQLSTRCSKLLTSLLRLHDSNTPSLIAFCSLQITDTRRRNTYEIECKNLGSAHVMFGSAPNRRKTIKTLVFNIWGQFFATAIKRPRILQDARVNIFPWRLTKETANGKYINYQVMSRIHIPGCMHLNSDMK